MNFITAISCLLALTASVAADASWGGLVYAPKHASVDYYAYPRYAFEYSVKDPHTGDNKAQWEKREGDTVKGAYSLVEPDGSLRIVEYWVSGNSGFNAVVKRIGPNVHPPTVHGTPIYKTPVPITVGPVAKLGGLAAAPLITGPLYGGAVSTSSFYKADAPAVPVSAPVVPVYKAPLPIAPAPIWPSALHPYPVIKSGPILSAPIYSAPLPIYRAPVANHGLWNNGYFKAPLGHHSYLNDLGHGLLSKGEYPSWGPDYNLIGLKH